MGFFYAVWGDKKNSSFRSCFLLINRHNKTLMLSRRLHEGSCYSVIIFCFSVAFIFLNKYAINVNTFPIFYFCMDK